MISGDGQIDEDDQDPSGLRVFDSNFFKICACKVRRGCIVSNQNLQSGECYCQNVVFIDIPAGLELSPVDNNGWMLRMVFTTAYYQILNGQCATREITLRVKDAQASNLYNKRNRFAENYSGTAPACDSNRMK
jgi:hypothetical protein